MNNQFIEESNLINSPWVRRWQLKFKHIFNAKLKTKTKIMSILIYAESAEENSKVALS
jgi:hypothetical protein